MLSVLDIREIWKLKVSVGVICPSLDFLMMCSFFHLLNVALMSGLSGIYSNQTNLTVARKCRNSCLKIPPRKDFSDSV